MGLADPLVWGLIPSDHAGGLASPNPSPRMIGPIPPDPKRGQNNLTNVED